MPNDLVSQTQMFNDSALGNYANGQPVTNQVWSGDNSVLFSWGPMQFRVFPLNIYETDHETATDWAKKEIAGAAIYREWVGENDEVIYFRGKLYPYRIGGLSEIELFDAQRRQGCANMLVRGGASSGTVIGWFVCEKLVRNHTYLSSYGIGQQIAFEAVLVRVPVPPGMLAMTSLWQAGLLPS